MFALGAERGGVPREWLTSPFTCAHCGKQSTTTSGAFKLRAKARHALVLVVAFALALAAWKEDNARRQTERQKRLYDQHSTAQPDHQGEERAYFQATYDPQAAKVERRSARTFMYRRILQASGVPRLQEGL